MNPWKCLITLAWLTGEDGLVAFWKMAYIALLGMVGVIIYHLVDTPNFIEGLWPLVWLIALMLAGSFGIKGLQLWFQSAKLRTEAKSELGRVIDSRRDHDEGYEPSP